MKDIICHDRIFRVGYGSDADYTPLGFLYRFKEDTPIEEVAPLVLEGGFDEYERAQYFISTGFNATLAEGRAKQLIHSFNMGAINDD